MRVIRLVPLALLLATTACSEGTDKVEQPVAPSSVDGAGVQPTSTVIVDVSEPVDPAISAVDDDLASLDGDLQIIDDALAELDTLAP